MAFKLLRMAPGPIATARAAGAGRSVVLRRRSSESAKALPKVAESTNADLEMESRTPKRFASLLPWIGSDGIVGRMLAARVVDRRHTDDARR